MVKTLTTSQRQVNDEVEDARTTTMQSKMLYEYGTVEIGVKSLAELNTVGWHEVCKDKFHSPRAFQEWVSEMDEELRKHDFNPLKTVPDGNGGKRKYAVDEDDEKLTILRNKYGSVVAEAVGVAALEIESWNPSGRYIIRMLWDFIQNKKASMSQIFELLVKVIKEKEREVKEKEKEVEEKDKQLRESLDTTKKTTTPAPKRKRT